MGASSWAAFGGTNDQAVVDGDMAILEEGVEGVLEALQNANIDIVAIHNHMTYETPRMLRELQNSLWSQNSMILPLCWARSEIGIPLRVADLRTGPANGKSANFGPNGVLQFPLLFVHFWGKGAVKDLATGIKSALGAIGS